MQPDWLPGQARFRLKDVMVDPAARTVSGRLGEHRLSLKAMGVLTRLAASADQVISRDDLLDSVWPEADVGEEVLTQAIAELRRCLGDSARRPCFIETVHKAGYRLIAAVHRDTAETAAVGGTGITLARSGDSALDFADYALYLQACLAFDRGGARNIHDAAKMFEHVMRARPGYAPAYAGLARSLAFIDMYYGPPGDHIARALEVCEAGLDVDPQCHEVLAAQGTAFSAAGKAQRAFASFHAAMTLHPRCGATHYLLGRALFAEGHFALAAAMQEHAARLDPEDFHSLLLAAKARRRVGDAYTARANLIRAKDRIDRHLKAYPDDFRALCDQACCLIELDEKEAAFQLMQPLSCHNDPMNYYLVCFLARADEIPAALSVLDDIVEAGWSHAAVLRNDPDIDALRGESRFRRIEQRLEAG